MDRVLRLLSALALAVGLSVVLMPAAEAGGCGWRCGGGLGWGRVVGFYPMPAAPGYVVTGCGGCVGNYYQYYARGGWSPCYANCGGWVQSCWYDAYGARLCASPCGGC